MVFFNCNGCGEALKKNQVEKHSNRCRNCQVLSCVDCGKDFWGNDYQSHTKCMTEEEKYCGPGHVSKVNKGEIKQEQWIEKVQSAIDKAASNPGLKRLLIRLKDYPNIPRKQQKFQNFLKNSLRIYDAGLCTQVWNTLMAHSAQQDESKKENVENGAARETKLEVKENEITNSNAEEKNGTAEEVESKKSKREKKEERRNKANKKEKKDKPDVCENGEGEEHTNGKKKSKKRKHRDGDDDGETVNENVSDDQPKKKKKKKHLSESENHVEDQDQTVCDNGEAEVEDGPKKKKTKFNWEKTITQVLKDKGEMSLKKLRKKVLGEFAALDAANYSEENLLAKFDKKVQKLANVQVLKERVKLKEN